MWWIIVGSILLILIYLLSARLFLEINSNQNLYRLGFGNILRVQLIESENKFLIELKLPGWKKYYPINNATVMEEEKQETVREEKISRNKFPSRKIFRKMKALIESFRIDKCIIKLDTGNMALNGILYPWFLLLKNKTSQNITINFFGENIIILEIENSLARMLWAYIKS